MLSEQPLTLGDFTVTVIVTSPPWYENCFIVQHRPSGELLVIDPGGDADTILAAVSAAGGTPKEILLTHGHPDHLGAVHALQTALAIPCRAHQDEEPLIAQAAEFGAALLRVRIQGPKDCQYFEGEPVLTLGGAEIRVISTPGHTPGGVCYAFDGFVFTGDTLFNHGVGRTDLPGGDTGQLGASLTRLLEVLPRDTLVFSGHGPQWTIGEARQWWRWAS